MTLNPMLLALWAFLSAGFVALLIYRGQLTRYEDEQLFLDDSARGQKDHESILRKLHRVQPLVRIVGGAAGVVTVCTVGIYVWNAWKTIQ